MPSTTFAAVTAISETDPGRYTAALDDRWTIGGRPNGGYLLAIAGRAAVQAGPHEHVLSASAVYVLAPEPGPVELQADVLRAGRSAAQVRVRMSQGGSPCVEVLVITGRLDADADPYWAAGAPTPPATDRNNAIRLPPTNPADVPVPIMGEVDLRLDRDSLSFADGRPSGRGELRGWLGLLDGEHFDPLSLLYAVDAFPPATFEIELTGWVPTLNLTAYVRALPAPGPLQILQRAHLVDGGRVDEACWVWDRTGRVVAHAVQLAAIRFG